MESLMLHRTLVLGRSDGILRCDDDTLPIGEPILRHAVRERTDLLDLIERLAPRAPTRSGLIAALALALKHRPIGDRRRAARMAPVVCRDGRELLQLAAALRRLGGFGRLTRKCLAEWYLRRPVPSLRSEAEASFEGWCHRDVLRLCHPRTVEPLRRRALAQMVLGRTGNDGAPTAKDIDWPPGAGRRLVAIDASAAMTFGTVLGERPVRWAARWGLAASASGDEVVSFGRRGWRDSQTRWRTGVTPLGWRTSTTITDAVDELGRLEAGPPDPGLLVRYAIAKKIRVDAFVVISAHPPWPDPDGQRAALIEYRQRGPAKMIVVGLKSGGECLRDPRDEASWGVQGIGPHTPAAVARLTAL